MAQKKASSTRKSSRTKRKTAARRTAGGVPGRVIAAIICFAVAVFLVVAFYMDAAGSVGQAITGFFFGVFGKPGYIVPLAFIAIGILFFMRNRPAGTTRNTVLLSVLYLSIILIFAGFDITSPSSPLSQASFTEVYQAGAAGRGGGIIGMYADAGLVTIIGTVGMFLFAFVLLVIMLLLLCYPYVAPYFTRRAEERRARPARPLAPQKDSIIDALAEGGDRDEYDAAEAASQLGSGAPPQSGTGFFGRFKARDAGLSSRQAKILSAVNDDKILEGDNETDIFPAGEVGLNPDDTETGFGLDPVRTSRPGTGLGDEYNTGYSSPLRGGGEAGAANTVAPETDGERELPFGMDESEQVADGAGEVPARAPVVRKAPRAPKRDTAFSDVDALARYKLPSVDLLNKGKKPTGMQNAADLRFRAQRLEQTLKDFRVEASVVNVTVGPTVTRYEVEPDIGVKIQSIKSLEPDLALKLEVDSVRVVPMPGKAVIGIEASNTSTTLVPLREIVDSPEFRMPDSKISFVLGKDISGTRIIEDLAEMPHLLIAGTTGSGKSVCVNSILLSILFRARPDEVKFIMIDPKIVELRNYNDIPHLLLPVVSEPERAATALGYAVTIMEERYRKFADMRVSSLKDYNEKLSPGAGTEETLPQIVIVIDELSDLMLVAPAKVQEYINRLAAKARAAGIHLIVATQQPLASILTSVIKANIPSRIAFSVASNSASRVILDEPGAERLLGKGDMLFKSVSMREPARIQGSFVNNSEVKRVTDYIRKQMDPDYSPDIMEVVTNAGQTGQLMEDEDEFFRDAVEMVVAAKQASVSMIQRRFRIGYNRAARLVDMMEERGIVASSDGTNKPRKVIMSNEQLAAFLGEEIIRTAESEEAAPPVVTEAEQVSHSSVVSESEMPFAYDEEARPFELDDIEE